MLVPLSRSLQGKQIAFSRNTGKKEGLNYEYNFVGIVISIYRQWLEVVKNEF